MFFQLEQLIKALLVVPLHEYKIPPDIDSISVLFISTFPSACSFPPLFRVCSWQKILFESLFFT